MSAPALKSAKRLPPLPTIKDLLKLYGLRAMKHLSQNFLLDMRLTNKIVKTMGNIAGGQVLEVGSGPGSITRPIIEKHPARVVLVEKDKRFLPTLEMLSEAASCDVDIILSDILRLNMENMFPEEEVRGWTERPPNIHLIGNLPFNVATPLIIRWLKDISLRRSAWRYGRVGLTLTFQKEVAERLSAPILSKQRCRLSLMAQNWCSVHHVFNIPGKAFLPKPDVDVGVVKLVPLISPVCDYEFHLVEKVCRVLFSGRQKYILKTASLLFPLTLRETLAERLLKEANIPPQTRAIQVTLPEVGRIIKAYNGIISEQPSLASYNFRNRDDVEVD
ncbi:unnamed protein product [Nezara viridula]|uniref:rRNA adenine N(6)-methyltransferase n=1 Tax=Nezara viridula TaxID=85310 RepID=A0A9P0MP52_NEZVI|nr:unnamed protein product [Nezara viridula]